MTTLNQLAMAEIGSVAADSFDRNPLTTPQALWESQILDVRIDCLRSRLAIMIENRTGDLHADGNTVLIVGSGVTRFTWESEKQDPGPQAWNIFKSETSRVGSAHTLRLGTWPNADLIASGSAWALYIGDVADIDEIPSYVDASEDELEAMLPQWDSEFTLRKSALLT